jgi:hypothetical protein
MGVEFFNLIYINHGLRCNEELSYLQVVTQCRYFCKCQDGFFARNSVLLLENLMQDNAKIAVSRGAVYPEFRLTGHRLYLRDEAC